jgi:hypothetical protein
MKKLFVAIIFVAALSGVIYFALTQKPAMVALPDGVGDTTGTSSSTPSETKTIKEETASYRIDVDYRLFGIPVVDSHVQAEVQRAIDAFKKDAANFDPAVETRPYSFTGEIADFYSGSDIVSERINLYQDTGGAHGLPIVLTLNYDAKTGETITVDRALSLVGLSIADVSAKSLAQLKQEFGDSVFAEGASPKVENYSTFIVAPYNVTWIFQAYQVVAYAAGMPEVKFNRTDQ